MTDTVFHAVQCITSPNAETGIDIRRSPVSSPVPSAVPEVRQVTRWQIGNTARTLLGIRKRGTKQGLRRLRYR